MYCVCVTVCVQLADLLGLELSFMLNSLVQSDLVACIKRETDHQMEVIKRRCEVGHCSIANMSLILYVCTGSGYDMSKYS